MNKIKTGFKILFNFKNPLLYLMDYFGLLKGDIIYRLSDKDNTILEVKAGSYDRNLINEIWIHKLYTNNFNHTLNKDDIIIDIGGHIGTFSIYASRYVKEVYSIEPSKAIDKECGKKMLYISKDDPRLNSLYKKVGEGEIVETTTLNKVMKENKINKVDLLKIDCEGAEYEILKNSEDVLSKVNAIVLEEHNSQERYDIVSFLSNKGFKAYKKGNLIYGKKESNKIQ